MKKWLLAKRLNLQLSILIIELKSMLFIIAIYKKKRQTETPVWFNNWLADVSSVVETIRKEIEVL